MKKKSIVIYVAKILLENVIVHIQIVHEKYFEFKRDECDKNFTKAFNVKRHIKNCSCKEMKFKFCIFYVSSKKFDNN